MGRLINLMSDQDRATTAIQIRIKRYDETYFILCDEYETVEGIKNRLLAMLQRTNFQLPKQEEPLTCEDIRLTYKNRVSSIVFKTNWFIGPGKWIDLP